jgi:hypothetical protein
VFAGSVTASIKIVFISMNKMYNHIHLLSNVKTRENNYNLVAQVAEGSAPKCDKTPRGQDTYKTPGKGFLKGLTFLLQLFVDSLVSKIYFCSDHILVAPRPSSSLFWI